MPPVGDPMSAAVRGESPVAKVGGITVVCGLLLSAVVGVALGCGGASPEYATISGRVTADGRPVTGAVITFEPTGETGGPKASAAVIGGRYEVSHDGRLEGGEYRVRISMMPDEFLTKLREEQPDAFPPQDSVIAPEFDSASDLRRALKHGEMNEHDFEIELRRGTSRR